MNHVFVSGATGFIGGRLSLALAEEGNIVHALYRTIEKTKDISHENIRWFKGDIMDIESLKTAMKDCSHIYHVAAFAGVWTPDPSLIYHLNIEGAINVINAALESGAEKIVVTSTAGVLGPSGENTIDETAEPDDYFLHYEHSKAILENILHPISENAIPIVIVSPSRVYGPGLLSDSNGVTRMVNSYRKGKWRIIPGNGKSTGNYVYIDDVVKGHILAMEKGKKSKKYILGGENADFSSFFRILKELSGRNQTMVKIPVSIIILLSRVFLFITKITGKPPLITPRLARKYSYNFRLSTAKAEKELGYRPIGLEEGLGRTLEWLEDKECYNPG